MSSAEARQAAEEFQNLLSESLRDEKITEAITAGAGPSVVTRLRNDLSVIMGIAPVLSPSLFHAVLRGFGAKPEDVSVRVHDGESGQVLRDTVRVFHKDELIGSFKLNVSSGEGSSGGLFEYTLWLSQEALAALDKLGKMGVFSGQPVGDRSVN